MRMLFLFFLAGLFHVNAALKLHNASILKSASNSTSKLENQNVVFDFGFFNGMDSWFYLHQGMKVIAIEADPTLVDAAKLNANFNPFMERGQLSVLNVAVAPQNQDKDTLLPFYLNKCSKEWNSFFSSVGCRSCLPPYPEDPTKFSCVATQVVAKPCSSVFQQFGTPKYVKLDIEGAEAGCYHAIKQQPKFRPPYLSAEVGDANLIETLSALGYSSFKVVLQKSGVSGEWGNDALDCRAGKLWRSKAGAQQELQQIFQKAPNPADPCPGASVGTAWYDLHASVSPHQTW